MLGAWFRGVLVGVQLWRFFIGLGMVIDWATQFADLV